MTSEAVNYSFMFPFERSFDHVARNQWMKKHWPDAFYYIAIYLLVVFGGRKIMANREPFKLRGILTLWNLILAVFSITGFFRVVPEMYYTLKTNGFDGSCCNLNYIEDDPVSGFWTWAFALSKVPELGDTVFIVLRKQNLIFLHWYHHVTVLLFTWYSYAEHISPARWYVSMNYTVHSMMYSYYAARALGYRLPKSLAMTITSSQIVQMIVGFYVTYYGYQKVTSGQKCYISELNAKYGLIMYSSYFVLFAHFFINSYASSKKRPRKDEKPKSS